MGKRKAESLDGMPSKLTMRPFSESFEADALCMYFPSGYDPTAPALKAKCQALSHLAIRDQYGVVAETVCVCNIVLSHTGIIA